MNDGSTARANEMPRNVYCYGPGVRDQDVIKAAKEEERKKEQKRRARAKKK